ncbi:MAG TPA: circularly permuted type 2 ATP-grasp protein, partial [Geminicoccaceae bacterium]|nr:circularly permuted type 2 ATP-grasp protein [Geminicoccaceae bacterium]
MGDSHRPIRWDAYDPAGYFCEMLGPRAEPIAAAELIRDRIASMSLDQLHERAQAAERELFNLGITFTVYSARDVIDRILPFDLIPRVLSAADWATIEPGVKQRVRAINLFLADVYHDQKILKDGVVPRDLVLGNANYRSQMVGMDLPHDTYVHICGI